MTKFSYQMNDADILKGIVSIEKRTATLRQNIHQVAVSILKAWAISKDAKTAAHRATQLLEAADKYKAQAIVNWFAVYAGFEYSDKVFTYTETTIEVSAVQAARDEPYWELSPPKDAKPFDLSGQIMALIEKAQKRRTKPKDGDNIPADLLSKLVSTLEG